MYGMLLHSCVTLVYGIDSMCDTCVSIELIGPCLVSHPPSACPLHHPLFLCKKGCGWCKGHADGG